MVFQAKSFRSYLDSMIEKHPELFPSGIESGYNLHDILPESKKMKGICLRRIELKVPDSSTLNNGVFTIRPSFVMPYMTGLTDDLEKALLLRSYGVPFWVLTYIFGKDDMYWTRIEQRVGHNSLVGTTVNDAANIPLDLSADEKHTRWNGEKGYIATTIAEDCVLGASVSLKADEKNLTEAYRQFKTESQQLDADYEPQTVNTDGWTATQSAWKNLFGSITLILCFLHSFIKIRDRCKRMKEQFHLICEKAWDIYRAADAIDMMTKVTEFKEWAFENIPSGPGLEAILKLCGKSSEWDKTYAHPSAYRTSNMLDRAMDRMDRFLYNGKYFHGHLISAEYRIRAWGLYFNFCPYCPRAKISATYQSPAHKLNGKVYHPNWLQNMMVSASMGGYRT